MIVMGEERTVVSPYVEWVGHGYTVADGLAMRPAEYNWHVIFTRYEGGLQTLVVGPSEEAQQLRYVGGAESLWIRFKVGTYMPNLPAPVIVNQTINLPEGSGNNFWLKDKVWDIPSFENVDAFVEQLTRAGALTVDPLIEMALRNEVEDASERTIRYRFQHITGMRQNYIRQIKRAQHAVELLQHGHSILHTAHELGYSDQPHLTRSLKRLLGYTPHELVASLPQTG